jgi:hypothetical protein
MRYGTQPLVQPHAFRAVTGLPFILDMKDHAGSGASVPVPLPRLITGAFDKIILRGNHEIPGARPNVSEETELKNSAPSDDGWP